MREIKFRAWDFRKNKMREVLTIAFARISGMNIEIQGLPGYHFLDDPRHITKEFELMQFTGLLDKDGKEIYEGDILKHYQSLHVIRWDEHIAGFSWRTCSMDIYLMFRKFVAENCEVVGNIYENEELLEAVK